MTLTEKMIAYPVAQYTRCCGWFVPKTASNPGKQAEYMDRKNYNNISGGNSKNL